MESFVSEAERATVFVQRFVPLKPQLFELGCVPSTSGSRVETTDIWRTRVHLTIPKANRPVVEQIIQSAAIEILNQIPWELAQVAVDGLLSDAGLMRPHMREIRATHCDLVVFDGIGLTSNQLVAIRAEK